MNRSKYISEVKCHVMKQTGCLVFPEEDCKWPGGLVPLWTQISSSRAGL